jgi:hypothetical protein
MFDLGTILVVNEVAAALEYNGSTENPYVRLARSARNVERITGTHDAKAFNRRVALFARDARVPLDSARQTIALKDRITSRNALLAHIKRQQD